MSAAFTPAPWGVRTTPRSIETMGPWREILAGELVIGEIYGDGEEDREPDDVAAEANANLIAAAPDLYEACVAVNRCGNGGAKLSRSASDAVRRAIAKARGEQSL